MSYEESECTVFDNGDIYYCDDDGKLHRLNGPAIERVDGYKEYRIHGKFHREDGPAVIFQNGRGLWFLNDVEMTENEWRESLRQAKVVADMWKGIKTF